MFWPLSENSWATKSAIHIGTCAVDKLLKLNQSFLNNTASFIKFAFSLIVNYFNFDHILTLNRNLVFWPLSENSWATKSAIHIGTCAIHKLLKLNRFALYLNFVSYNFRNFFYYDFFQNIDKKIKLQL